MELKCLVVFSVLLNGTNQKWMAGIMAWIDFTLWMWRNPKLKTWLSVINKGHVCAVYHKNWTKDWG